jgi:ribosomal protein S18 acetylase RimI-like enzyme
MPALAAFCAATVPFLAYRDLFVPHVRDVEVWLGFELHGAAALATAPLHWAIFAVGAWAFWRQEPWVVPAAAAYTFYVALSHLIWSEASPHGNGWAIGLAQAAAISIPGVLLLRARRARASDAPRLRRAGPHDLAFLRQMLYEAAYWRPGAERPALEEGLARVDLAKLLAGFGTRPGDTAIVAESPSGPVGAAWLRHWSDADHSYGFVAAAVPELGIGVRAEARRRGIGEMLLRALLDEAARQGVASVSLSVETDNPAARLYERLGFRPVARVGGAWTMVVEL